MLILLVDDEPLARNELSYLLKDESTNIQIDEADSIESALSLLIKKEYDVVFLDIHLNDASGMDLAKMINQMPNPPIIIFATAYDEYALEAFEKNAQDYLLKPYESQRIHLTMEKIRKLIEESDEKSYPKMHAIDDEGKTHLIETEKIIMIEAQQGVTIVHTKEKDYENHFSLNHWQDRLNPENFMRVHRSFIVNLANIETIEPWFNQTLQLNMLNQLKASVSRSNVKALRERLGID